MCYHCQASHEGQGHVAADNAVGPQCDSQGTPCYEFASCFSKHQCVCFCVLDGQVELAAIGDHGRVGVEGEGVGNMADYGTATSQVAVHVSGI